MGTTIFFSYKLKRTRRAEEVYMKMTKAIKKKGVTRLWKCELCEDVIFLDFGDNRSETFVLDLKEKSGEGFCKVAFDMNDDEEIREKAMDTLLIILIHKKNKKHIPFFPYHKRRSICTAVY